MSDQFVDDLFATLDADRQEALSRAATATRSRERVAEAARIWWVEFCAILEHKVNAWNEKDAAGARVTCAMNSSGAVRLWHRTAEAELRLAEPRVVMTGRVGETRPRESPFIEFTEVRGTVTALLDNSTKSPAEAADHVLAPIFRRAFAG